MTPPRRPRLALQVGLVGHRDLTGADLGALGAAASSLLQGLGREVDALHRRGASSAYDSEPPVLRAFSEIQIGAADLLARAALAADFSLVGVLSQPREALEQDASRSVESLRETVRRAGTICELDDASAGGDPIGEAASFVVEHADLLIAIWDEDPAGRRGGTGDVVRRALEQQKPVAVLPPGAPQRMRWLGRTDDATRIVDALLKAPEDGEFPAAYFTDTRVEARWAARVMKLYEWVVSQPFRQTQKPTSAIAEAPFPDRQPELQTHFDWADRLAVAYGARYRVAGLMRYGLILPATAGSVIASFDALPLQIGGNLLQFAMLAFLVAFSSKSWQAPAHRRFVAYRALAERLRCLRWLAGFGASAGYGATGDWTDWLAGALLRAAGPKAERFDAASLSAAAEFLRQETLGQVRFLKSRSESYARIAGRLSRIGVALAMSGVGFSGLRALVLFWGVAPRWMLAFNETALILPAMAPVFLGLLGFYQYRAMAERYRGIAEELEKQVAELERTPPRRAHLLPVARQICKVLLAESLDWRSAIQSKAVSFL